MIRNILLFVCVCVSGFVGAQEVTFLAQGPELVQVGERFMLTYTLNSQPSNFEAPTLDNFYIVAGPSTSTNTSIEMLNGKVTRNHSITYTYVLEAVREGKFTINPARAKVNKREYSSNSVEIEVIKADDPALQQSATQQNGTSTQQVKQGGNLPNDDLFVTVELNKRSAFIGEPIEATILIYARVDIAGFEDAKFPPFDDFWSQEIQIPNNINFKRVNVDGKIYNAGVIRKFLLFPQKSDNLKIEPFELGVVYNAPSTRPRSIFDDFFGAMEQRRKKLVSRPTSINIKPLPDGAPETFNGAVGRFKLKASIDKTELKTNEAVTVKVGISGSGNMKLIGTPKVNFPAGFELFDPKTTDNISAKSGNVTGTKSYEYIAIPRTSGVYEIPPVQFSYFDINQKAYVTLSSDKFTLTVAADTNARNVVVSGYSKEDVKFIGKDIRFIKTNAPELRPMGRFAVVDGLYRLLYAALLVVFVAFLVIYKKHKVQMSDMALVRNRKANKTAQKRLKTANSMLTLSNSEKFYEEVSHALNGYVADKLGIPLASLTLDNVKEKLTERNVENADIDEFTRIIDTCEYARFSPKAEHSQMDSLYSEAYKLISKLEQELNRR